MEATPAPSIPFVYPMHSLSTKPTPTLAQMFSATTPISTVTPEQLLISPINPCHRQQDQTPLTCKPDRYLYNTWLLHRNCK